MPTAAEYVCCCEIDQTIGKMTDIGVLCIIEHESFEAVGLNVWVLRTVCFQYYRQDDDFVGKSANK